MKQTATNQFQDGLNYDLHPIVTPNSVLTDNINGTFITYNGNEFCLQNDKGNTIKTTLSKGFIPIGIKEHNGVLYIASCKKEIEYATETDPETGEEHQVEVSSVYVGELGTYPGIDWKNAEPEKEYTFLDYYTPLCGLNIDDADLDFENNRDVIYSSTLDIATLRTSAFNFDPSHPVTIEIQDSYDGSVNLILNDNLNEPRIINTGFSVLGNNKYKLIKRNIVDKIEASTFDVNTNLIKSPVSFVEFELVDVLNNGQLKGGNYVFYAKLGDADGNQTDIIAESGIVSIFKGTVGQPKTISGTLADERTDKSISFQLQFIPNGYEYIYLYYTRYFSDTQGYSMTEHCAIEEPYKITETFVKDLVKDSQTEEQQEKESQNNNTVNSANIVITGFEKIRSISEEDLNISYYTVDSAKAIAQSNDMLFLGNISTVNKNEYEKLDSFAKLIKTSISCRKPGFNKIDDNLGSITSDYSGDVEYFNIHNIYDKVGYWPNEYYRFGVVFIFVDGKYSNVYNMYGGSLIEVFGSHVSGGTIIPRNGDSFSNEYGVFKTPTDDGWAIIHNSGVIPWHFVFNFSNMRKAIEQDATYKNKIAGYFIVRQKRIPEVITQGLQVPISSKTSVPCLYFRNNKESEDVQTPFVETFVAGEKELGDDSIWDVIGQDKRMSGEAKLIYIPENVDGGIFSIGDTPYEVAIPVTLNYYGAPTWEIAAILGLIVTPGAFYPITTKHKNTIVLYAIVRYDAYGHDGQLVKVSETAEGHSIRDYHLEYWFRSDSELFRTGNYSESNTPPNDNPWWTTEPYYGPGKYLTTEQSTQALARLLNVNNEYNDYKYLMRQLAVDGRENDNIDTDISSANNNFMQHIISVTPKENSSALLSAETILDPTIKNRLDGSKFDLDLFALTSENLDVFNFGRHKTLEKMYDGYSNSYSTKKDISCCFVSANNPGKVVGTALYKSVLGNAYDGEQAGYERDLSISSTMTEEEKKSATLRYANSAVRGKFTPYIGINSGIILNDTDRKYKYGIVQISNRQSMQNALSIRQNDSSPFYIVSKKYDMKKSEDVEGNVYRGDCYVVTQTIRMITNFIDPLYPFTEAIVDADCWKKYWVDNFDVTTDKPDSSQLNITDLNTVSIGHWVTFKCLANSNINLRSEDSFDVVSTNIMGNPRSFYPLQNSTTTPAKQMDSELFNSGYGKSVGSTRYQYIEKKPYYQNEYKTRVMFSNKQVHNQFVNGYRVFQGLSYQDYDKQYGEIVKLLPYNNNLFCVFEHGLSLLPIYEKALMKTTTEQTIHIYGHDVLPKQMTIVSPDYGSKYEGSVVQTPIGIYGVDTEARKVWRFSAKQGFETISDMKIESFLNKNLASEYIIDVGSSDIKTHYNSFKGDVIFTWYTSNGSFAVCFNERQGLWTTQYDWTPLISENVNGEFYSLQFGEDSNNKVGIYHHSPNYSKTTYWYGKQHPFEFEFVVSDPIGVHKIFENLQIISNNVQPEELTFEFIGDAYMFNKERVYHTMRDNESFGSKRVFGTEYYETRYVNDPNKTEETSEYFQIASKPGVAIQQLDGYTPFRNASILNDRNNIPNRGCIIKTDNATEQYYLHIPQECRNIETWGRRLGNIHYNKDFWSTNIEPILYDARLNNPHISQLSNPVTKWNSARIRDKWCKIRVRYSGEDLAVITAIKTILNI